MRIASMVGLAVLALAGCNESVKVHVSCTTTAAPAVECTVVQTEGKSEVEACWDFATTCANGVVVEAPHTCSKVKDGATVTVTIPGDKLTNLAKCGGDGKPTAKMSNMTINGKPSEL